MHKKCITISIAMFLSLSFDINFLYHLMILLYCAIAVQKHIRHKNCRREISPPVKLIFIYKIIINFIFFIYMWFTCCMSYIATFDSTFILLIYYCELRYHIYNNIKCLKKMKKKKKKYRKRVV
eukprot:304491_1